MRQAASLLLFVALFVVLAACVGVAQIHGVAPSVTSFGFGGSQNPSPGVPASVTSLGPQGFSCCSNLRISTAPNFIGSQGDFRHHSHGFPVYVPFYTPAYTPSYVVVQPATNENDEDTGGPPIFDRRDSSRHAAYEREYDRGYEEGRAAEEDRLARQADREARAARREQERVSEKREAPAKAPEAESPSQAPAVEPKTALVFRDGHAEEVANYAIVGDQLYDFTAGKRRIAITDLDVPATVKANDARGMDFRLPVSQPGN